MKKERIISFLLVVMMTSAVFSQTRIIISNPPQQPPDSTRAAALSDSLRKAPGKALSPDSPGKVSPPDSLRKSLPSDSLGNGSPADSLGMVALPDSLEGKLSSDRVKTLSGKAAVANDSVQESPLMTIWHLDTRTGDRLPAISDTLLFNYQHTTLPDGYSIAMGFLAPLGSPSYSKIFFDRPETDHFIFNDAYLPYLLSPQTQIFLNVRVPYSRLDYQQTTAKQTREERFKARLASNFGKRLNVGVDVDLINSLGFYNSQAVKQSNFTLYGNYLSERLEAHAYANLGSIKNFENGGITNEGMIVDPDAVQANFSPQDIPVKFKKTWNTLSNNRFLLSARYNLGYRELPDSLYEEQGKFIPVASIGFSSQYVQQRRIFFSYDTTYVTVGDKQLHRIDQFYPNRYYADAVYDSIRFSSLKNSLSLSLREGFKEWVKFGLTAFLEYDLRNYTLRDSIESGYMRHRENAVTLGGILNKQQGENLRFNVRADLGVLGVNLGEFRAMGDIQTGFTIAGKRTTLAAEAYVKNLKPRYLQKHYYSKYFRWDNTFGDTRRIYVGGRLYIPFTHTTLTAGVENIQNHIYFDQDKNIVQEKGNVQLLTARIDQDLHLGIFNWDNRVVYQASANQQVIPLPMLSVYSNMYLKTKIVNELTLQLGVDAHYHTKYFAPGYEPALLQFYHQQEKEIGNYPIATVYANMHLKQTRFFLMFYNVASKLIKPAEYFSIPGYPVNPFVFKLGLSVNLHN